MLFRTSMNKEETKDIIQSLLQLGFSKDKIIIHSDVTLLEDLHLKRIHFKENDTTAFTYKEAHPDTVSYTHLTLPTTLSTCRSRWSPYH